MHQRCSEGVVLRSVDFRDDDQILTVFSFDCGVIKLIAKGSRRKVSRPCGRNVAVSPMTRAEFRYVQGPGELMKCYEIEVIDHYLSLRKTLDHLSASSDMLSAILLSQMPEKPAPNLYKLLAYYFERLPKVTNPHVLSSSYYLKTLKHEGVFSLQRDASPYLEPFTQQEFEQLHILTHCCSFSTLASMTLDATLASKIKQLFALLLETVDKIPRS